MTLIRMETKLARLGFPLVKRIDQVKLDRLPGWRDLGHWLDGPGEPRKYCREAYRSTSVTSGRRVADGAREQTTFEVGFDRSRGHAKRRSLGHGPHLVGPRPPIR